MKTSPVILFTMFALCELYTGKAPLNTKIKYITKNMDVERQHRKGYDIKGGMFLVDCSDANGGEKVGMNGDDFSTMCHRMQNPLFEFMHHGYSMQVAVLVTLYTTAIVVGIWSDSIIPTLLLLTYFLIVRVGLFLSFEIVDQFFDGTFDSSDHIQFGMFFVWAMDQLVSRWRAALPWRPLPFFIAHGLKIVPLVLTFNSSMLTVQYYHTELEVMIGLLYGMVTIIILEVITPDRHRHHFFFDDLGDNIARICCCRGAGRGGSTKRLAFRTTKTMRQPGSGKRKKRKKRSLSQLSNVPRPPPARRPQL